MPFAVDIDDAKVGADLFDLLLQFLAQFVAVNPWDDAGNNLLGKGSILQLTVQVLYHFKQLLLVLLQQFMDHFFE